MSEWNFIGDIHGDMKSLEKLSKLMPKAPFFSVGDLVDRFPRSKEVLQFFMEEGNKAVLGNHEHMMLDFYFNRGLYDEGLWLYPGNGGLETLKSLKPSLVRTVKKQLALETVGVYMQYELMFDLLYEQREKLIPKKVISWVDSLPVCYEEDGLFVSHAPRSSEDLSFIGKAKEHKGKNCSGNLIWNILEPVFIEGITQIHGHVIYNMPKIYTKEGKPYGYGIDTWKKKGSTLTGLHWPSMQFYSVVVD